MAKSERMWYDWRKEQAFQLLKATASQFGGDISELHGVVEDGNIENRTLIATLQRLTGAAAVCAALLELSLGDRIQTMERFHDLSLRELNIAFQETEAELRAIKAEAKELPDAK